VKNGPRAAAVAGLLLGAAVAASFRLEPAPAPQLSMPRQLELEGTVTAIDRNARTFVLTTPNGGRVDVRVPTEAPLPTRLRFRQIRAGDFVHLEGVFDGAGAFLLARFIAIRRVPEKRGTDDAVAAPGAGAP
jgi:hypothetical protein